MLYIHNLGIGIDGRLGHGDELTLVVPKLVETLKDIKIVQIAASRNNSYFLSSDGHVYTCGSNEFNQLGQQQTSKSLVPRQISVPKKLKGKKVNILSKF